MREVTTHLRVQDPVAVEEALAAADLASGASGPLVAVLDAPVAAEAVAGVLAAWIAASREAMGRGVDVVTVLADTYLDGDDVGRLSVGHGLVAASRAWGFEGERAGLLANVVVGPHPVAFDAAAWLLAARSTSGQVLLVGDAHHGRQRP
jgi:hypothetical protein